MLGPSKLALLLAIGCLVLQSHGEPATAQQHVYESLLVVQPEDGETLWNIGGNLDVRLRLEPALRPGDRVRVHYDREPVARWPDDALEFRLGEVWRGEHTLQAFVEDRDGRPLIESPIVNFYVHQTTIHSPQRRRR